MVQKLKSASTNQTLRLTFKAFTASFVLYWMRSGGITLWQSTVFIAVFGLFYFRPSLNNVRFVSSALAMLIIPFLSPALYSGAEFLYLASWGASFFMLLGSKNLILVERQKAYRLVHFAIVAGLGTILIERFGLTSEALVFVALLFIFREYYITITKKEGELPTLIAALEALVFIELAWISSFLTVDVLVGGAFLTLFALIFHDTTVHRLTGTLSTTLLIRNAALFGVLALVIASLALGPGL